ncbi:hypothetical protein CEXT_582111 [Caerostris extrusa]|uniref:Uncharacterized protein n=1 Tax=Caerostris extrusa TaxID=172846 RepID=A0AAV4MIZ3_CAEEX|nr:hypothetical protein CEXT_582111 [Caerostris extrusa]
MGKKSYKNSEVGNESFDSLNNMEIISRLPSPIPTQQRTILHLRSTKVITKPILINVIECNEASPPITLNNGPNTDAKDGLLEGCLTGILPCKKGES